MNEENNRVENQDVENQDVENYSYRFNPNENVHSDNSFEGEKNGQQESYTGGYQRNNGNTLRKSLVGRPSSMMRNHYGIRGPWNSGKISVLAIVAILGILALIIIFLIF